MLLDVRAFVCSFVRSLHDRLGIMKERQPLYVATYSEKPAVLEGHPFIVEAGVSLGGAEASGRWFHLAPSVFYDVARPCLFFTMCFLLLCVMFASLNSRSVFSPLPCSPAFPSFVSLYCCTCTHTAHEVCVFRTFLQSRAAKPGSRLFTLNSQNM